VIWIIKRILGQRVGFEAVGLGVRGAILAHMRIRRVMTLFSDLKIRQMIRDQPKIRLEVTDNEGWFGPRFPEDVDELHFQVVGVLKDLDRLKALFDRFAVVLDRLCRPGSA
jgi:hypothetical protein